MHPYFFFLLLLSMSWAALTGHTVIRGVALWLLLVLAVAVREIARAFTAAAQGVTLRSVLLLPTGGIYTYGSSARPSSQRALALTGPIANLTFGIFSAAFILALAPQVDLKSIHWVTPQHLLRALVWINLLLAAVHMLPAWPLDGARLLQGEAPTPASASSAITRIGPGIAISLIVAGAVLLNYFLIVVGIGILLTAQAERHGLAVHSSASQVQVKDVMLTEYSLLSASATLEDALEQSRHTLQDVFPVIRGNNVVGAVSRQGVQDALGTGGNSYVQGIMARSFHTAAPTDSLVATLGRINASPGVSSDLVPVVLGERIVGILTPNHLGRSVGLLNLDREASARRTARNQNDETT